MKRIVEHIFLLLAFLAFGLSAASFVWLEQNAPGATDEQYISTVQQRVKEELKTSTSELQNVVDQLKRNPKSTFSELQLPTRYPYFVFRNRQLFYWSDYRFIPEYTQMAQVTGPKLVEFEQGQYIVSHQRVVTGGNAMDVFSLVNISHDYQSNNAYAQSGYNPDIFALNPQTITDQRQNTFQAIYDNASAFLFSVVPPKVSDYRNHSTPVNTVILITIGIIFLGMYVLQLIVKLARKRHYERGFILLAAYLIVLRAGMLYAGLPFLFIESDLFNPKFYASSVLVPSLGDLLLNILVVVILAFYWVNYYYRSRSYLFMVHRPYWLKSLISVICVVASYGVFAVCYTEWNNIYDKSQFTLDITLDIRFSFLKVVSLAVFVLISFAYFLLTHLLAALFLRYNPIPEQTADNLPVSLAKNRRERILSVGRAILLILAGTGLVTLIMSVLDWPLKWIFLLNGIYFLLIYVGQFPKTLYSFRYKTSIYLFLAAFICALASAYVVYNQEIKKKLTHEKEFASQLLAENDVFREFLLNKAQDSIAKDPTIANVLQKETMLVRERIQQRVKTMYLEKYFDKYDIEVFSFRADGRSLDISPDATNLEQLKTRYRQASYKTEYPTIFFINEIDNQFIKQYVCFITIQRPGSSGTQDPIGYIVLDLRLQNERPKSVYPELLSDANFIQNPDSQEYSYAFFSDRNLNSMPIYSSDNQSQRRSLYSTGTYNYDRRFDLNLLGNKDLYDKGILVNGYQHVAQRRQDGRTVVVSSPEYPFQNIVSNFSFLYLILVLMIIFVIIGYAIKYRFSPFNINFSTQIQILLNIAFFVPLTLVIVIILTVTSSNYGTNQENAYISNTRNIASNFLTYLDEHMLAQKRSKASMEEELSKIARDADIDINLFDAKGRLYTSTRPLIYESGYLSKRINPEAYVHIIEDKENQVILDESLGDKQYRTAYVGVKSYGGKLLGVLSVPYFYAGPELDRQIIDVIASALSIFTGLLIVFLIVSYVASHRLTAPLQMLTQKIRKTNLDHPNEPLKWRSDDEIGLLIQAYNQMLVKLEESKQALAQTEKQSAWREMAKQVAHEIKNPLTPMKLTLQHLQRTLPNSNGSGSNSGESATRRVIQRTFDSLLEQIDNLSDIATSFSDFAKMPLPKKEVFEVTNVLNRQADLYADDPRITLQRQIAPGPVMTTGDRQLIGRIITNLIINAIQSVPADRRPVIDLRLYKNNEEVQIEIHDNGVGIPDAIRTKVFLPNFSTKRGGTGLGLAIAKRGVEHAGGNIWFETTEGVGTSFFVSLPLANVAESVGR